MGLKLMETEKDYYIFGSPAELVEKMKQNGFENILCIDGIDITERDIRVLQKLNKGIVFLAYEPGSDDSKHDNIVKTLKEAGLRMRFYSSEADECDSLDSFLESFKDVESMEQHLNDNGITRNWDYNGRCGNCHNMLEPEDKYCRACGTKRGQGKFEPYFNTVYAYYGTPLIYNYKCSHCGTTWQYTGFGKQFYCPNCGEKTDDYTYREMSFAEMFGLEESDEQDPSNKQLNNDKKREGKKRMNLKEKVKVAGEFTKIIAEDVAKKTSDKVKNADIQGKIKSTGASIGSTASAIGKISVDAAKKTGEKISTSVEKAKEVKQAKKEMNFQSVDSLQQVVNVVNEAAAALNDSNRTIRESAIPEVLAGALGAGVGGVGSFALLYGLGAVGLSAAGITSGLATAGAIVGGGMVAGVFVLAAPVAALAGAGILTASKLKSKQLRQEKERLYEEALRKHEAIINALQDEVDASQERMNYLQSLNILLQQAVKDLKTDIELGNVVNG